MNSNVTTTVNIASWMQEQRALIGDKKLNQLCITGSHDSGMYKMSIGGTIGAHKCNTVTQSHDILGQLNLGMRYFDIRPVIASGKYYTGHYTKVLSTSWQGANGESIQDIVSNINTFTASHNELIILNLSHSLNTDLGNTNYQSFTQKEWEGLFAELLKINHLFTIDVADLTEQTLNFFIGNQQAAVLIIVENTDVSLQNYIGKGFYPYSAFNAYNSYADTNDVNAMIADQLKKMKDECAKHRYFLLSWTLTQDASQAVSCALPVFAGSSIKQLANEANDKLKSVLEHSISKTEFPNIIYCDDITSSLQTEVAMYINSFLYA